MIRQGNFIFTQEYPEKQGLWILVEGDALESVLDVVPVIATKGVDCWITSPPYFNQFSYGVDGQVGLEPTVEGYMDYMTRIASRMLQVSKPDANLFWVIRDSYNGSGGLGGDYDCFKDVTIRTVKPPLQQNVSRKAQLLIPERTRIAFADVGWVPIIDIIWDKKDSRRGARDRPSYSYEHILVFSAAPNHYWNRDAVLTPFATATLPQLATSYTGHGMIDYSDRGLENPSDVKRNICKSMKERPGAYLRSVWDIPSGNQPVVMVNGEKKRAFTAFPELLAEICVNLGCPPGGLVVDPFCGFGTTLLAASRWGRDSVGIDINPEFIEATRTRLGGEGMNGTL